MPGLRAFCITAAICIGFIFLLQISWTVAWLSLDQGRIERNQHGLIPCITVPDTEQAVASRATVLGERTMHFYSDLFKYWPFNVRVRVRSFMGLFLYRPFIVEVLVLLISGGLLSVGVYGSVNIVQRFDPNRMLPRDSYLSRWINVQQDYYAGHGFAVWVKKLNINQTV